MAELHEPLTLSILEKLVIALWYHLWEILVPMVESQNKLGHTNREERNTYYSVQLFELFADINCHWQEKLCNPLPESYAMHSARMLLRKQEPSFPPTYNLLSRKDILSLGTSDGKLQAKYNIEIDRYMVYAWLCICIYLFVLVSYQAENGSACEFSDPVHGGSVLFSSHFLLPINLYVLLFNNAIETTAQVQN